MELVNNLHHRRNTQNSPHKNCKQHTEKHSMSPGTNSQSVDQKHRINPTSKYTWCDTALRGMAGLTVVAWAQKHLCVISSSELSGLSLCKEALWREKCRWLTATLLFVGSGAEWAGQPCTPRPFDSCFFFPLSEAQRGWQQHIDFFFITLSVGMVQNTDTKSVKMCF